MAAQKTDEQWQQHVDALMQGKLQPSSSQAAYTLKKLQGAKAEFNALTNNLAQTEQRVAKMREDALRLDGIMGSTMRDLCHWESQALPELPAAKEEPANDSKVVDATLPAASIN